MHIAGTCGNDRRPAADSAIWESVEGLVREVGRFVENIVEQRMGAAARPGR